MISSIKRKSIILSLAFLTIVATHSFAQLSIQSYEIGAKGGGNFFKIGGRSFDNKTYPSFNAGGYVDLNFTPQWSLQGELLWSEVIAQTSDEYNQIYPGGISSKIYNNYMSLPILVAFKPAPEISILVGPEYGYLVSQTSGVFPGKDAFSKSDFSLVFGGQLNLGAVKFGARYSVGLNNINGINSTDQWRMYGFQLYLGYRIWNGDVKKKK